VLVSIVPMVIEWARGRRVNRLEKAAAAQDANEQTAIIDRGPTWPR
jgi:hypothetical protein